MKVPISSPTNTNVIVVENLSHNLIFAFLLHERDWESVCMSVNNSCVFLSQLSVHDGNAFLLKLCPP